MSQNAPSVKQYERISIIIQPQRLFVKHKASFAIDYPSQAERGGFEKQILRGDN
jgi:hypothetical protein